MARKLGEREPAVIYRTEGAAVRRVFCLARLLGVWPGYFYSDLAGGWVLTYDPQLGSRAEHEGSVLG